MWEGLSYEFDAPGMKKKGECWLGESIESSGGAWKHHVKLGRSASLCSWSCQQKRDICVALPSLCPQSCYGRSWLELHVVIMQRSFLDAVKLVLRCFPTALVVPHRNVAKSVRRIYRWGLSGGGGGEGGKMENVGHGEQKDLIKNIFNKRNLLESSMPSQLWKDLEETGKQFNGTLASRHLKDIIYKRLIFSNRHNKDIFPRINSRSADNFLHWGDSRY